MLYYKFYHPIGSVEDDSKLGPVLLILGLEGGCKPELLQHSTARHGRYTYTIDVR